MRTRIQRYFISGLLVWLPIWVTVVVIRFIVDILDGTLRLIPRSYQPDILLGVHIPGLGVVITLALIFFTGMIAANFIGKRLVALWDAIVGRIPLVRSVHAGVKQILQTLFTPGGQSFRKVLLVEWPRKGMWSVAFQTGETPQAMVDYAGGEPMVSIFIPTTPNPTSGFLMMVPKHEAQELDISVEQALKFVISLGVVTPTSLNHKIRQSPVDTGQTE